MRAIRDALIVVALVLVPFFFLSANLKSPDETTPIDDVLIKLSGPVQSGATWLAESLGGVFRDYFYLVDVGRENDRLVALNRQQAQRLRQASLTSAENRRLTALLDLRSELGTRAIAARVIAKDVSSSFRVVRVALDRGSRDQVRAGMPVVSTQGLVGQIRRAKGRYSDVLLTVDSDSRVDVVVERTGARGRVEGVGERDRYACRVQFDRREDEIKVGDELFTSGLGKKFPPGILVGTITTIDDRKLGLTQRANVAPSVDFTRLAEVLIVPSGAILE